MNTNTEETLGQIAWDAWNACGSSYKESWQAAAEAVEAAVMARLSPGLRAVMERLSKDEKFHIADEDDKQVCGELLSLAQQHLAGKPRLGLIAIAGAYIIRELDRRHRAAEEAKAKAEAKAKRTPGQVLYDEYHGGELCPEYPMLADVSKQYWEGIADAVIRHHEEAKQ